VFFFPFIPKYHKPKHYKNNDPRRFLGHTGIVTLPINRYRPGQIKIEGTLFRAAPSPDTHVTIHAQSAVTVIGIHSDNVNTLIVQAVDWTPEDNDPEPPNPFIEAPA
jgi:membrane protein implicated in regulation of membrane protease activity